MPAYTFDFALNHAECKHQGGGPDQVLEMSDGEEEKKAAKKSGGRPSRARGAPRLWRNLRERALWRTDLAGASRPCPPPLICSLYDGCPLNRLSMLWPTDAITYCAADRCSLCFATAAIPNSWRTVCAGAGTVPRVAYCCIVLAVCAGELLETLEARQVLSPAVSVISKLPHALVLVRVCCLRALLLTVQTPYCRAAFLLSFRADKSPEPTIAN